MPPLGWVTQSYIKYFSNSDGSLDTILTYWWSNNNITMNTFYQFYILFMLHHSFISTVKYSVSCHQAADQTPSVLVSIVCGQSSRISWQTFRYKLYSIFCKTSLHKLEQLIAEGVQVVLKTYRFKVKWGQTAKKNPSMKTMLKLMVVSNIYLNSKILSYFLLVNSVYYVVKPNLNHEGNHTPPKHSSSWELA